MRSRILIIGFLIFTIILGGCSVDQNPQPSATPGVTAGQNDNQEPTPTPEPNEINNTSDDSLANIKALAKLFPDKEGFKWVYNGFAEYGHELNLDEIVTSEDKAVYKLKGEVFDMSDGESDMDYTLTAEYAITPDAVIQTKTGEMMMDTFDQMELIRGPLEEGKSWTQTVKDNEDNEVTLNSTIEKIETDGDAKVYHITYKAEEGPYYENRIIKEGVGVISYTKLYMTEGGNYELSYFLYDEASGYDK